MSNLIVAVAHGTGASVYSTDGNTFTAKSLPAHHNWTKIIYANSKFLTISEDNVSALSLDEGSSWAKGLLPNIASRYPQFDNFEKTPDFILYTYANYRRRYRRWTSVAYGDGIYVAVACNTSIYATSTDGINWTERSLPNELGGIDIVFSNNQFIVVPNVPGSLVWISSTNGITWTSHTFTLGTVYNKNIWTSIATDNISKLVVSGTHTTLNSINNASSWSIATNTSILSRINDSRQKQDGNIDYSYFTRTLVSFDSNKFILLTDGVTKFNKSNFESSVRLPNPPPTFTSDDGITWMKRNPSIPYLTCIAHGSGRNIVLANNRNYLVFAEDENIVTANTSVTSFTNGSEPDQPNSDVHHYKISCHISSNRYVSDFDPKYPYENVHDCRGTYTNIPRTRNVFQTYYIIKHPVLKIRNTLVTTARSLLAAKWTANDWEKRLFTKLNWSSIAFGANKFIAVALNSISAFMSDLGESWTQSFLPSTQSWEFIDGSAGKFIYGVIDENYPNSTIEYSIIDGTTWHGAVLPKAQDPCIVITAANTSDSVLSFDGSIFKELA